MIEVTARDSNRRNSKDLCCDTRGRTFRSGEESSSHQRIEHSQSSQPPAGVS
jgi:hypothetical protein